MHTLFFGFKTVNNIYWLKKERKNQNQMQRMSSSFGARDRGKIQFYMEELGGCLTKDKMIEIEEVVQRESETFQRRKRIWANNKERGLVCTFKKLIKK